MSFSAPSTVALFHEDLSRRTETWPSCPGSLPNMVSVVVTSFIVELLIYPVSFTIWSGASPTPHWRRRQLNAAGWRTLCGQGHGLRLSRNADPETMLSQPAPPTGPLFALGLRMRIHWATFYILAVGCGSTPGAKPLHMGAMQHVRAAAER